MKLFYELEDSVVGIIIGVLVLVYAGVIPPVIPYFNIVFPLVIGIFLALNFVDIIYFAKDFHENIGLSLMSLATNIVDILINLSLLSVLVFRLPVIHETLVPLFAHQGIIVAGAYLVIINVAWIIWYHKG